MKAFYDILGILRSKVSRDSSRTEAIIKNGFYDYIIAFDIIIDGKWKMRNTHSKMSVKHRMDPRHFGEFCESLVNACHKMLNNPCTTWSIEVLGFDKIKFCQGRKANTFCLKVHFGEPEDELLLLPNCCLHMKQNFRFGEACLLRNPVQKSLKPHFRCLKHSEIRHLFLQRSV